MLRFLGNFSYFRQNLHKTAKDRAKMLILQKKPSHGGTTYMQKWRIRGATLRVDSPHAISETAWLITRPRIVEYVRFFICSERTLLMLPMVVTV